MSSKKVIATVEVSSGDVRVIGVDGSVRTVVSGDFIYLGEEVVSDDPQAFFQIKYSQDNDSTIYEGIFDTLTEGVDTTENVEQNENQSDIFETEAGAETLEPNTGFIDSSFETSQYLQDFLRATLTPENDENEFFSSEGSFNRATPETTITETNENPVIETVKTSSIANNNMVFRYYLTKDGTDLSGNGRTATDTNKDGIYTTADNKSINLTTYSQKTIAVSFTTSDTLPAANSFEVIYEQGGGTNGYSISTVGTHIYAFAWRESGSNDYHSVIDLGEFSASTDYNVVMVHDATGQNTGTLTAYLDGVKHTGTAITDAGVMAAHSGDVGIGGIINHSVNPTDVNNHITVDGSSFSGTIKEVISWNDALNDNQVSDISNYFSGVKTESSEITISESNYNSEELFSVTASDPENDTISFSLDNNFNGLFAIDNDGKITVDGLVEYDFAKTYDLVVRVTDSQGASSSKTLTVNVQEGGDIYSNTFSSNSDGILSSKINLGNSFVGNSNIIEEQTISLWFKKDAANSTGNQMIYEEGGSVNGLNIYLSGNTLYAGGWEAKTGKWYYTDVDDTEWHHVVLTYDGDSTNEVSVTLDKTLLTDSKGSGIDSNNDDALAAHPGKNAIGGMQDNTFLADESTTKASNFQGDIDNLRIYENVLDAKSISILNKEGVTGSSSNDILEYTAGINFDGASGTDTLVVSGAFDLSNVSNIKNIEKISLETGATVGDAINGISVEDVYKMSDSSAPIELLIKDLDTSSSAEKVNVDESTFTEINTANTTDGIREFEGSFDGTTVMLNIEDTIDVF